AGLIEPTPGRSIDKRYIVRRLAEVKQRYDLQAIAFDRWGTDELKRILEDEGIELPLIDFGQGYKDLGPAVNAMETLMLARKIRHDGHAVLRWNVSNAIVETDPAGARKPSKRRSRERIDGLVALCMAVGLQAREPAPQVYDFSGDRV